MKFVIPAGNVKIFARSIFSLAKLGDEIYIEPLDDSLTLRTVNSSRSAFSCFSFKRSFFTQFESSALHKNRTCIGGGGVGDQTLNTTVGALNETTNFRKGNNNDQSLLVEDHEQFKCKLPAKSLLSIFRSITSLEKNIEKCTITVKYIPLSQDTIAAKVYEYDSTMITKMVNQNNEEQLYDTKFLIIMHSKYGVRKTFILSISDCESLQTAFLADNCSNRLNISAKYFHETINSFSNDTEEITFLLEANKLVLRNYVEPESNDGKPLINTHVSFDSDEFNSYEIEKEMDITFCLKEFKICLMFGYYFDLPLDIYFKKKGRPIIFCYNRNEPNAHYEANFTLATLVDETVTSQSTITTVSADVTAASNSPVISLREAANNNKNNNQMVSQHIDRQREEAAKTGHSILKTNAQNNKGNKRTIIFDGDVYLGNEETASREENNDNSADEDALLTQALNYQEQTFQQQVIETRPKSSTNLIEEPPSKKMKSLIQNMFEDDNSEENNQNRNEDEEEEKETNRFLKKRHGLVSLGHLLEEDTTSRDSEEHNQQMEYHMTTKSRHHTSIYIENTDSEGE